ncbi:hypothetical protein C8R44DRAFT_387016 [Mycena epipterygia]|nr:hypothetical protein C8R44DRAFT_387016 [Mycena epipterygia]
MLSYQIMPWIRRSTGRICVEIVSESMRHGIPFVPTNSSHTIPLSSLGSDPETRIIHRLTMDEFHRICDWCLSRIEYRPMPDKVHLGAIGSLQDESLEQIAHIPNCPFSDGGWSMTPTHTKNGWSRLHSSGVTEGEFHRILTIDTGADYWLCQANYIISQQNQKNCSLVFRIAYWLRFFGTPEKIPEGYLFLCPVEHLRDDMGRWVPNPECPAYWSLDPSGNQRLSPEEAFRLGFPSFELDVTVVMKSWHESVYAALSRFHAGKGFDPNSQDLARHLGYPLYELSRPTDSAHIEEIDSNASDSAILAQDPSAYIEELDSNDSDDVILTQDIPHPQKFRVVILGALGLILAIVVSWSYTHLVFGGEKDH